MSSSDEHHIDVEVSEILVSVGKIEERTSSILHRIEDIEEKFTLKAEFLPVKNIVFGLVGIILTSFIVAFASLVINK